MGFDVAAFLRGVFRAGRRRPTGVYDLSESRHDARIAFPPQMVKAGVAMALQALGGKRVVSVLVFGLPRVGKTSFCRALVLELESTFGARLPLIHVSVPTLSLAGPSECKRLAKLVVKQSPVALIWDDLDSIGAESWPGVRALEALCLMTQFESFESEMAGRKGLFLVGVASNPSAIDRAFLSRFEHTLYLPVPDRSQVIATLTNFGITSADEVERQAVSLLEGSPLMPGTIAKVAETVPQSLAGNPSQVAQALAVYATPLAGSFIDRYQDANQPWIRQSQIESQYFESQYDTMAGQHRSAGITMVGSDIPTKRH